MTLMVDFLGICDILFSVMRDRIELEEVFENEELFARELVTASRPKMVKVKGPWVDGVQTVKEISQDEWTSYTPLNRRVRGEWFRVVKW
jgi:hypothetical protein